MLKWLLQIRAIYTPALETKYAFSTKNWKEVEAKIIDWMASPELAPRNVVSIFGRSLVLPMEYDDIYTNEKVQLWVFMRGKGARPGDIVKIKVNPAEAKEAFMI